MLDIYHVTKTFGLGSSMLIAVNDVSFTIEKNEFVSIVGKSGCGKSTLLNLIGGLDKPDSGEITLGNNCLTDLTDDEFAILRRKEIGFIFQNYNLLQNLRVKDNILLPLGLDNKKLDDSYFHELLLFLDIESKINNYPSYLSGGEQQRVAIARAMINRPSIILADEPTGNLDAQNGLSVLNLLKETAHEFGQTVICVTHDIQIADAADRIIHMADGKIIDNEN